MFSLIDQAAAGNARKIYLSGFGEPLLDERLPQFVAHAGGKKFPTISITSNGMLLTSELSANLIEAGLNEINISLDGFTPESYAQTRLGLEFERVIDNIKELHAQIQSHPLVRENTRVIVLAVALTVNRHEGKIARSLLGKYVDRIYFRQAQAWTANYNHDAAGYAPHFATNLIPCRYLWDGMSVYIDGRVPPCCLDYEAKRSMGDAIRMPIADIWQGERFASYRRKHLENRKAELSPCAGCGFYFVWW